MKPFEPLKQYPLHKDAYLIVTIATDEHNVITKAMEMEEAYNYEIVLLDTHNIAYNFNYYENVITLHTEDEEGNKLHIEAHLARH